ncbi:tautomerase family protein [Streptomyces beihaiensis]|uniref:Tautomerase family protein n=1 Tax=Streptomyces beihaiensis TaxID=2984495 RepID=A0ABT3TMI2_9ACTN|nr:tautomerase family protein [Streptomyces beihaiensis]MCX3058252.1 tautomerase family protein [Streptomyces beihaiensis]
MPLVRIDALGSDMERLEALGRAVHDALVEVLGFPSEDLFQILTGHDGRDSALRYGRYLGGDRDDGVVFVGITLRAGRPDGQKRALYRRIAELADAYAGTHPRNVVVSLTENGPADWSFGYGLAQYAPEL